MKAVPNAALYELGRAALGMVTEHLTRELAEPLISTMVQRFGEAWLRGRVDYYAAALASADALADAKFGLPPPPGSKP
jgi:hypothetical protein